MTTQPPEGPIRGELLPPPGVSPTNTLAVTSLILGIRGVMVAGASVFLTFVCCGGFPFLAVAVVLGAAAAVCGHVALRLRAWGDSSYDRSTWTKDAFHRHIIGGEDCVNPSQRGTKAAVSYGGIQVPPGESAIVELRLTDRHLDDPFDVAVRRLETTDIHAETTGDRRPDLLHVEMLAFDLAALENVGRQRLQDGLLPEGESQSLHVTAEPSLPVANGGETFREPFAVPVKPWPALALVDVHSPQLLRSL